MGGKEKAQQQRERKKAHDRERAEGLEAIQHGEVGSGDGNFYGLGLGRSWPSSGCPCSSWP